MKITAIKSRLIERGVPVGEIRVKYRAGDGPHVCILTKGVSWTCAPAPIDDESDERFADFLIAERNKARKK